MGADELVSMTSQSVARQHTFKILSSSWGGGVLFQHTRILLGKPFAIFFTKMSHTLTFRENCPSLDN